MGAISGLLGLGGGQQGTGVAAPQGAPIVNPTSQDQVLNAYNQSQQTLQAQNSLLGAIQQQGGLGNQSQVYNQLQGVANGTGPNPAQAMLSQATGQNVANQAALMAGQRGAASNVGLIARQAAQQGAATQQQSANQAAVMQANQSLNALGQAGQMANTQATNEIGQTNALGSANQAQQQALINAQAGYNNNLVGQQSSINAANAGLANTALQGQQATIGGLFNAGAGAAGFMPGVGAAAAHGGELLKMADGGMAPQAAFGPQSEFGQFLNTVQAGGGQAVQMPQMSGDNPGAAAITKGLAPKVGKPKSPASGGGDFNAGGNQTLSSPAAPMEKALAQGGMTHDYRGGGKVNAKAASEKAVKSGNSYANDKIPAVLSEHEIVIPRNITMGKDPVNDSARFVASVLAKRRGK